MILPRQLGWMAALAMGCNAWGGAASEAPAMPAGDVASASEAPATVAGEVAAAFEEGPNDPALRIETQLIGSEFAAAAAQAEQLIDALQRATTRYDPALSRPLALLGDARLGLGDAPGALEAYDRALHIARINHGLFDPGQVDIVYREAVVHAAMGDAATADARHEYAYNVLVRAYGHNHPDLVPGIFARAEWFRASHNIFFARNLYQRAAKIGLREFPAGDARTIRALRGVAATFRDERFPPARVRERPGNAAARRSGGNTPHGQISLNDFSPGEQALIDVINQLQARADATEAEIALAMLELADWYLLFDKHSRAVPLYRRVWQLFEAGAPHWLEAQRPERGVRSVEGGASKLESAATVVEAGADGLGGRANGFESVAKGSQRGAAWRAETLGAPAPLYLPLPPPPTRPKGGASDTAEQGIVELAITVTERGRVVDIETLRSEPEGLMDHRVRRATRSARYRPMLTDGGPVRTEGVRIEYRFAHYPLAAGQ